MVTFVVSANVVIGVVCLLIAWKICQLRRQLAKVAATILVVENVIHRTLDPAPKVILKAKGGTERLRHHYERLGIQMQKIEGFLVILRLGEMLWQRRRILSYGTELAKRVASKR